MKKIIIFPLWQIERLEKYLENMEQQGFRLENIKYSYCFYFKESTPKQMHYFLSYKSFRGQSMGHCDYALESKHNANQIKCKKCFFTMYRTKEQKENLSLLYKVRLDYVKSKLLEKALTVMFIFTIFTILLIASLFTQTVAKGLWIIGIFMGLNAYLTIYYFYGYFKQKTKCKNYKTDQGTVL